LDGNACSIYEERPNRCREFECDMLRQHTAGVLTREECSSRVVRVKDYVEAIAADLRESSPNKTAEEIRAGVRFMLGIGAGHLRSLIHASPQGNESAPLPRKD
jgi:hypothetical protein